MSDVQIKCPSCGAPLNFDAPSGEMKCDFCGSTFTVPEGEEASAKDAQSGWSEAPATYIDESTGEHLATFHCGSCGGEIVGNPDTVSTKCPWCNNNFVSTSQLTRTRVPDRMIPFGMSKEQALAAFNARMKKLWLLPKDFRNVNMMDVQGVYVPYWLYDASVAGQATYRAERVRSWRSGDYEYTEHRIYQVERECEVGYLDVPVSGTSKITGDITEAIEPFDYSKSTDFAPGYLSGFVTNKYDIDSDQANPRALDRMKHTTSEVMRQSVVGFTSVKETSCQIKPAYGDLEYVFLPVWLMNITWNGKNYQYAMNGQTGKFVGTFPVSWAKFWGGFFGLFFPLAAITGVTVFTFVIPQLLG